jgi:hypothetical protein
MGLLSKWSTGLDWKPFVLALSILALPSIGLLTLPGAIILLAGAIIKNKS